MLVTYYLLATSVLLALLQRVKVVIYSCILITIVVALYQHIVFPYGVLYLFFLALLSHWYSYNKAMKPVTFAIIAVFLVGVLLHKVPGFSNALVFDKIMIGGAKLAYTMYHNFDKVMAALMLYTFTKLIVNEKPLNFKALGQTLLISVTCMAVIFAPAMMTGFLALDIKIPRIFPLWAINNLLFVCFSEEVIFRGFLQNALIGFLPNKDRYKFISILVASCIFGIAHFSGGVVYVGLASLAGLFYGYAYYKTGNIFCSMLVHFALNTTHFLLLTYPS